MTQSWYIAVFQLPFIAPTAWNFFNAERWGKMISQLEQQENLPLNQNIVKDGKYGVNLYRANFCRVYLGLDSVLRSVRYRQLCSRRTSLLARI